MVQTFTGVTARRGRTLWVSDGGTVDRWVEDAGGFELVATARGTLHRTIIPGQDDDALFKIRIADHGLLVPRRELAVDGDMKHDVADHAAADRAAPNIDADVLVRFFPRHPEDYFGLDAE